MRVCEFINAGRYRYEREGVERLAHLLALVRIALAAKPCDFFGMAFMSLELGDKHRGQFFTP